MRSRVWLHALPLVCAILAVIFAIGLVDITQGVFGVGYAIALAFLGLRGQDAMPWARLDRISGVERALWVVVVLLFVSGLTDIFIAVDFWTHGGKNLPQIVGLATWVGVFLAVGAFYGLGATRQKKPSSAASAPPGEGASSEQQDVAAKVDQLMSAASMHRDPDLNLNRLARKLGVPARQVSVAINRAHGVSVSQYVNERRIADACELLTDTDESVTNVMLKSGFNTKSNFNREFKRVTGMNPSAWRAAPGKGGLSDE